MKELLCAKCKNVIPMGVGFYNKPSGVLCDTCESARKEVKSMGAKKMTKAQRKLEITVLHIGLLQKINVILSELNASASKDELLILRLENLKLQVEIANENLKLL